MINITNIIKEFRAVDLQAFINDYELADLYFPTYFPSFYTPKLTFEALEATMGAKVAADVVAFDSRAPRKGRYKPGKITGDIPKVEVARAKNETELNTYRQLLAVVNANPTNQQAKNRLIDWIYEDTQFALDGVNARQEWLAKQAVSNGKYSLTVDNNEAGVQTKVDIDFGIPAVNRKNAVADWSDAGNAKPITDIRAIDEAARKKGYRIRFATTDHATMLNMLATAEVRNFCASFVQVALDIQFIPNLEQLNAALARENLPTFRVWDSYVAIEGKKGAEPKAETGWIEGNVCFSVAPQLGQVQWTDTADAFVTIDDSVKAQNDFTLVKVFALQDPISVITKGVAYATPVLDGALRMFILKTKLS